MPERLYRGDGEYYEAKLHRVMKRLGVQDYTWDWSRWSCWVQFRYKGQLYRFEHSVQKAQEHKQRIRYGVEAFAQLVLALEDLARLVERGIYDLQQWIEGMKALPEPLPSWCAILGFDHLPKTVEEVHARFRELAKQRHPDAGGSPEQFQALMRARDEAIAHLTAGAAGHPGNGTGAVTAHKGTVGRA